MDAFFRTAPFFLVHYGDIVHDQDLRAMVEFHRSHDAWVTLLVHRRARSNSVVKMDASGQVSGFWERPATSVPLDPGTAWVNSGVFVCDPRVLDLIPEGKPSDFPRDVFPGLVRQGRVFGFPLSGYRCAVDSPERLAEVRKALAEHRCRSALIPPGAGASAG
jgi:NDP-sugar pyrophosphorylase family protein